MTTSEQRRTYDGASSAQANRWAVLQSVFAELLGPEPTVLRFPNGEKREAGTWHDLYCQIASWLVLQGKIHNPVPMPAAGHRYLVNVVPQHEYERFDRVFELPNGMYLEGAGNSQLVLDRAVMLLEMFEVDPSSIDIYLEQRGADGWIR